MSDITNDLALLWHPPILIPALEFLGQARNVQALLVSGFILDLICIPQYQGFFSSRLKVRCILKICPYPLYVMVNDCSTYLSFDIAQRCLFNEQNR